MIIDARDKFLERAATTVHTSKLKTGKADLKDRLCGMDALAKRDIIRLVQTKEAAIGR